MNPLIINSLFVGVVAYFLLMFAEELLGINRIVRLIFGIIAATLFYNFGGDVMPLVSKFFNNAFGL